MTLTMHLHHEQRGLIDTLVEYRPQDLNDKILNDICDLCQDANTEKWMPVKDQDGNWVANDPEQFCFDKQKAGECAIFQRLPELIGQEKFESMHTCLECCRDSDCCVISSFFPSEIANGVKICPLTNQVYPNRNDRDEDCAILPLRIARGEITG